MLGMLNISHADALKFHILSESDSSKDFLTNAMGYLSSTINFIKAKNFIYLQVMYY